MRTGGTRASRLSTGHTPYLRIALVATLAGVQAVLGGIAPARAAAANPKSGKIPANDCPHRSARGKTHRSSSAGPRLPGVRPNSKRRAAPRVAGKPRDLQKLTIPQGDGSPVVASVARFLGRPYRFGADDGAFDCSGLVRTVFAKVGIDLPHSARDQFARGERVSRDDLEPGDLVFFHTSARYATHVGIYVGDDRFVHAASHGGHVQIDSLANSYYARRYLGARRIEI